MSKNRKLKLTGAILIFMILGCNMLGGTPQPSDSAIRTAAAQTLQLILTPSITGTIELASSPSASTPAASPTAARSAGRTAEKLSRRRIGSILS